MVGRAAAPRDQRPDVARRSGFRPASLHISPLSGHCQVEATLALEQPTKLRINSGLNQQFEIPKVETPNEPPTLVGGCDDFKCCLFPLLLPLITAPAAMLLFAYARVL